MKKGYIIAAYDEEMSEKILYWVCNNNGIDNYTAQIEKATIFNYEFAVKSMIKDIYTREDMAHAYLEIEY